ncbi:MAG: hypothetical protein H6Q59_1723 [Firmicutes bacterium]|nr:hypothetical protein [Bacillota bacterium]
MKKADLLNEVSVQYGLPCTQIELIRHNENITYCIDNKYLLRVHKPKSGFNTTWHFEGADIIKIHEDELIFLEHLKECGMNVQSPIRNVDNKLVTVLKDGTPATMLTWLAGRTVNKNDLTEEFGRELGEMIGKLHLAAKGYHADSSLNYNQDMCKQLIELLSSYSDNEKIDKEYYNAMSTTLELIGDKLKQSESEHILLHSDLSLSNILITENGLVPIDFSLLGYSNPLLDLGSVYCFVSDEKCRMSIIKAYEEVRGCRIDIREIEYYFALQILLGIALHHELWSNEEWFAKRLPEWCNEIFWPLANK